MWSSGGILLNESPDPGDAEETGRIRLAPPAVSAKWDPSTLPTEEADDEPRWSEIQLESRDGDVQLVKKALSQYPDKSLKFEIVNQPAIGYYGQTALEAACMNGYQTVVQVLLEAGAHVNAPGGNNVYRTAFELACGIGNITLIRHLLNAGAIVNPTDVTRYQGRTPIQAAAEGGHEAVVLLLSEKGADINAPVSASAGVTALQTACYQGYVRLLKPPLQEALMYTGLWESQAATPLFKGPAWLTELTS
ncbi:hypothetical protein JX265_004605 [Neoarthrinium moseri]|uniref:Uncharacterized protein n=1 Tax=Neoarthrinium moseri TaxID=1658444 RepID=A0A9P9WPT6_9PEZI|nr:hypothetical protein JX265_004605 [Neoarthrinium moseri]